MVPSPCIYCWGIPADRRDHCRGSLDGSAVNAGDRPKGIRAGHHSDAIIITLGFVGLLCSTQLGGFVGGLVPRFEGSNSVILAASMLLGSNGDVSRYFNHIRQLVIHRHGAGHEDPHVIRRLLKATGIDIIIASESRGS